jgi:hypothetical protein
MKKFILVILILGLISGLFYLISIAPYHIYTLTLTEGVDTRFLKMKPTKKSYYDGKDQIFYQNDELISQSKSIYKSIHLQNFLITLPILHPSLSLIPEIKVESNKLKLGASIVDVKYKTLFSFMPDKEFIFDTGSDNQELYLLPVFRNYISKKSQNEIWKDVFSKKLSLPSNEGKSFKESLDSLNEVSYKELVYNLYILNLRTKLLPENIIDIRFDQESSLGFVTIAKSVNEFSEKIYYLNEGIIYPISLKTNLDYGLARFSRDKLIKELKFKLSNKDSAIPIYAEYKQINYQDRIDQKGMIYLFSAWSHDTSNKDFIRVIILFLERGKTNIKYLRPFYEYAFKKFGSSFSNEKEFLIESPEEKLKRKMSEELEKEATDAAKSISPKYEGDISDKDEKIKSMLQKAKEKKVNSDEKVMELNME